MKSEPVLSAGAIVGVIMAGIVMAMKLGWIDISSDQLGGIEAFVVAAVGLLFPLAAAWWARSQVTPVAAPKTKEGEDAVLMPVAQAQALGYPLAEK